METLEKYLEERKTAINSFLAQPRSEYTVETFHKLRVEIKKLNALFDLVDFCCKDFKRKKTFKPFRKIFRRAGKVRELQIEEAVLQDYCFDKCLYAFQNTLELKMQTFEHDFFQNINEKVRDRINKKFNVIESYTSKIKGKKASAYMEKKNDEINKPLSKKTIPPKKIHELRKLVKLHIYNTDGLDLEKDEAFAEKKALAELLGQWHDLRVITRHLCETKKSEDITPEELLQLSEIIKEIKNDTGLLYSEINLAVPVTLMEIPE